MATPIRIHPQNPKLFEFRGKPLVLVTATEHYGAVINRPFHFERYLADVAEKRITLTRLFMLFRELQTPINPYSTCKPESPDYISPFARVGPERALDQELKYDLDRPNPEFFARLHRFLSLASEYGIIVEVVLFSSTYNPQVWSLNPLNAHNNINGLEEIEWYDYLSQRHPKLFARQVEHVRKIVRELNRYDNIIFEICNEPGGSVEEGDGRPSIDEVNRWLAAMIQVVRETEADLPNKHLIAGQEAYSYKTWSQSLDLSFSDMDYDIVNVHPLPATSYGGRSYHLGTFMSKQLVLRELRDCSLTIYGEGKPLNHDEDNIASQYKDVEAWTIHRKRAWTSLLSGAHYDYIDFSIVNYCETGTPASQRHIRSWMRYLSEYVHSLDLVRGRPLSGLLYEQPPHTLEVLFGVLGEEISIYLADERELAIARDLPGGAVGDPDAGEPIRGRLVLDVPEGAYRVACYDPKSGLYSPWVTVQGGKGTMIELAPFVDDLVVRMTRV